MKQTPLGTGGLATHTNSGANIPSQGMVQKNSGQPHNLSTQNVKGPNMQSSQAINFRQNLNISL